MKIEKGEGPTKGKFDASRGVSFHLGKEVVFVIYKGTATHWVLMQKMQQVTPKV